MGKNIKRLSLSKSAVIGCLIAATALTSLGVNALTKEKTSASTETQVMQENTKHEFLIDARYKLYRSFDKAAKIAGFKFKVPDYKLEGFAAMNGVGVRKINDSENYVNLFFSNKDDEADNFGYDLEILRRNPKEVYSEIYRDNEYLTTEVTSTKKTIGNIEGEDIAIVDKEKEDNEEFHITNIFAYEEEGIYYALTYSEKIKINSNKWDVFGNIDEDEILKIINSLKKVEDITNVKYFEDNPYGVNKLVYDQEDLNEVAKELGFIPKIIDDANKDFKLDHISYYPSENNLFEFTLKSEDNVNLHVSQSKDSKEFNDIKDNKYLLYDFDENCQPSKSEKISINNKEVYKIKEKVKAEYAGASNEYVYIYAWESNGIYFKARDYWQDSELDSKLENVISEVMKQL